jgi:uncharacterized protein
MSDTAATNSPSHQAADQQEADALFVRGHALWMGESTSPLLFSAPSNTTSSASPPPTIVSQPIPVDNEAAFRLFKVAAEAGHAGAQCALAILLLCGSGTPRDDVAAVRWLKRAADQHYTRALRLLGSMWSSNRGRDPDHDRELFIQCREAAHRGIVLSRRQFQSGPPSQRLEELTPTALCILHCVGCTGDPASQHYTALLCECGRGTEQSTEEAIKYYEMAIENGYALSINNLGYMYYRGAGVEMDKVKGLGMLHRAAGMGLPIANTTLGFVHKQGDDNLVEKNLEKAIECFTLAADNGDAVAQLERMLLEAVECCAYAHASNALV